MKRAILIAAALGACERAGSGQKTVELPLPKVTVTLIDAGAEPRAPIRIHRTEGEHTRSVATRTGSLEAPRFHTLPASTFVSDLVILDVHDGVIHSHQRIVSSGDSALDGVTFDNWRDFRGAHVRPTIVTVPDGKALPPGGFDPRADTVAPDEPVGEHARWHEDIELPSKSASFDCTLEKRDGDRIRFSCENEVRGAFLWHAVRGHGRSWTDYDLARSDESSDWEDWISTTYPQGTITTHVRTHIVTKP